MDEKGFEQILTEVFGELTIGDYVHDYFGPWAVLPQRANQMHDFFTRHNIGRHIAIESMIRSASPAPQSGSGGSVENYRGGIREIEISGIMMKRPSSLFHSTSTIWARRAIRNAVNDNSVKAIILRIESPGGIHAGTSDLAKEIEAASNKKPVTAYIEDMATSAAYWIASQANRVVSNSTAVIGSIGTFLAVYDSSENYDERGVTVHVLRAGAFKGRTVPGIKIDDEVLKYLQQIIDGVNQFFLDDVGSGRKMNSHQLAAVGDGRVYIGNSARRHGLIDGVESFDEAIEKLAGSIKAQR